MPRIKRSVYPAYLLEPTTGMHCPLASGLGSNIFLASLLLASCSLNFVTKGLNRKLSRSLATVILAAHDLNEHGGKHRLLQISSQPISNDFEIQYVCGTIQCFWLEFFLEAFITTHVHF